MKNKMKGRSYVDFEERPVRFRNELRTSPYDVVIKYRSYGWYHTDSSEDRNKKYCNSLLELLTKIHGSFQQAFLKYHINLLQEPVVWLRSLEQLLDRNTEWFVIKGMGPLLPYWYQHIIGFLNQHQTKSIKSTHSDLELENDFFENHFDIEKVKRYQYYLNAGIDRVEYLMRMEMNYLHHKHKYFPTDTMPFNEQIKLELTYQDHEDSFFRKQEEENRKENVEVKFQINGSIETLAIAFKKMIDHPGIGGQPFLSMTPKEAVAFLLNTTKKVNEEEVNLTMLYQIFECQDINDSTISRKKRLSPISLDQYYNFDINEVIRVLSTIKSIDYKILFLLRVQANFMQHRLKQIIDSSFEKKIGEEIFYQKKMQGLRSNNHEILMEPIKRFQINGQLNIFMDVFYELKNEIGADNQGPYLINNKKELSRLLAQYFVGKNYRSLNSSSLYEYFKPINILKRCSAEKRIHFKPE